MAPTILIALLMLLSGDDAPVATQARPAPVAIAPKAPTPAPQPPILSAMPANTAAPTDDYGYVSWCYGALATYVDLYDQAMPEVTRIEKEFPGPEGIDADLKVYPELRAQARSDLKLYAGALAAAEKASPKMIAPYGQAAAKRGKAVWNGAISAPKAKLAQMWMSWSPPERCETVARKLKAQASVLGQALAANTPDAAALDAPDAPTPAPAPMPAPKAPVAAMAAARLPAPTPVAAAPQTEAAVIKAPPAPSTPIAVASTAPKPAEMAMTAPLPQAVAEPPAAAPVAPSSTTPAPSPAPSAPTAPAADPGVWYRGIP